MLDIRKFLLHILQAVEEAADEAAVSWEKLYTDFLVLPEVPLSQECVLHTCSRPEKGDAADAPILTSHRPGTLPVPNESNQHKIDWKTTVLLNLVCEATYELRVLTVRQGSGDVLETRAFPVYANPYHANIVQKNANFMCSLPHIFFHNHQFTDENATITLEANQNIQVELVALIPKCEDAIIFKGSLSYEVIAGVLTKAHIPSGHTTYIPLIGPEGAGRAQIGVTFQRPTSKRLMFWKRHGVAEPLCCVMTSISRDLMEIFMKMSEEFRLSGVIRPGHRVD